MSSIKQEIADELSEALAAINQAIAADESGMTGPYPAQVLRYIRDELMKMRDHWPSYPFRFGRMLVDYDRTDLGNRVLKVADNYERSRKRALKSLNVSDMSAHWRKRILK